MKRKAFVLLSGGLDSTTALYKAIKDFEPRGLSFDSGDNIGSKARINHIEPWVEAVSIDYGQRHKKEMHYATTTCERLGIKHYILNVGELLSGARVMLTNPDIDVPDIDYADIKGVSPTYVPFRNGLMLSALTAHAQKYVNAQIDETMKAEGFRNAFKANDESFLKEVATRFARDMCGVYFGAHSEDAQNWAYPDCTPEFIGSMANAIYIGSYQTIRLHTPLQWLMKKDIVKLGGTLGVHFEDTWSCYKGDAHHCGVCPTCRSRKDAFLQANVVDPTEYENERKRVNGVVWPKVDKFLTNEEVADKVYAGLSDVDKNTISEVATAEDMISFHHGVGTNIRNEFHMWHPDNPYSNNNAKPNVYGVVDHPDFPDQRSHEVLKLVWKKVNANAAV